jgi:hypothetical protein
VCGLGRWKSRTCPDQDSPACYIRSWRPRDCRLPTTTLHDCLQIFGGCLLNHHQRCRGEATVKILSGSLHLLLYLSPDTRSQSFPCPAVNGEVMSQHGLGCHLIRNMAPSLCAVSRSYYSVSQSSSLNAVCPGYFAARATFRHVTNPLGAQEKFGGLTNISDLGMNPKIALCRVSQRSA